MKALQTTSGLTSPGTHPVPSGYQNGRCFYCEEPLAGELIHGDHVIPRTFLNHGEIWNLVLAHSSCNLEKNARLPSLPYLNKLYECNEYSLDSNHPNNKQLIAHMGPTPEHRGALLERIYRQAEKVLIHVWKGPLKGALQTHPLTPLQTDCSTLKADTRACVAARAHPEHAHPAPTSA